MDLLRAFLASELPPSLQDAIQSATADLRTTLGSEVIRWIPAHNIHLTLKFLGDVSPSSLDLIKQMLLAEAGQYKAFDILIEGIGCYPSPRRPRILWVGMHAPATLASLQRGIDSAAARLGYESEEREFSPHLTIGRVRQNISSTDLQKVRAALEQTRVGNLGSAHVDAVCLFKSDLQPAGSVYTRLFAAPLLKN